MEKLKWICATLDHNYDILNRNYVTNCRLLILIVLVISFYSEAGLCLKEFRLYVVELDNVLIIVVLLQLFSYRSNYILHCYTRNHQLKVDLNQNSKMKIYQWSKKLVTYKTCSCFDILTHSVFTFNCVPR